MTDSQQLKVGYISSSLMKMRKGTATRIDHDSALAVYPQQIACGCSTITERPTRTENLKGKIVRTTVIYFFFLSKDR
jgi:hypothetical protein